MRNIINSKCMILMRKCVNLKLECMKIYNSRKKKKKISSHTRSTCDERCVCVYKICNPKIG